MSRETLAAIAGAIAAALSLSMTGPQAATIWRDRSYVGVSVGSWMLLTVTASTWAGFAVRTDNVSLGAGNTLFLVACWCIILATLRADRYPSPRTVATITGCLATAVVAAAAGLLAPLVLVVLAGLAASFVRVPQLVQSFRTWSSADASEVSQVSLWVGFAGNWCWTLHGVLRGDPFVTIAAAIGMLVAGTIIVFELAARRHRAREAVPSTTAEPRPISP